MIKTLAIDMGGVFATNPPRHIIREIALEYDLEVQNVVEVWRKHWGDLIVGNITEDAFYESLIRDLHIEGNRQATINEIRDMARNFTSILPHVIDFFKRLKQMRGEEVPALLRKHQQSKLNLALISNTPKEWWDYISEGHDLSLFEHKVLSFEKKDAKPNPAMFEDVINHFGIKAEEMLVVDDKASNCESAQRLGCSAHRYTDLNALIAELLDLHVINAREANELQSIVTKNQEDDNTTTPTEDTHHE